MKRRTMSTILIFALILGISGIKVNADTEACKITLSPQSTSVAPGKTIDIAIKMSDITDSDGLAAYTGTISFDSSIFTYSKISGYGEWETPTYNEGNIVSLVSSGMGQTTDQTIAILTLQVNSGVAEGSYKVSFSNITVSNGIDTLSISSASTTVKVANSTSSDDDNSNTSNSNSTTDDDKNNTSNSNNITDDDDNNISNNTNTNSNSNSKNSTNSNSSKNSNDVDTTTASKSYSYAGIYTFAPIIIIIAIVGIASYYKYKKYNIK